MPYINGVRYLGGENALRVKYPGNIEIEQHRPSLIQELHAMAMRKFVAQFDDLIRIVINKYLKCVDYDIELLRGRLELKGFPNGIEILCLDGVALMELHPLKVEFADVGDQLQEVISRNYRELTPNGVDSKNEVNRI